MFLVDSAEAAGDWEGINELIRNLLEKGGAEIISMKKWDERKLAYDIKGKSRGTYILCYFRAKGEMITAIERGIRLSERIMRVLILIAEQMTQEDMDKPTPAMAVTEPVLQQAEAEQVVEKAEDIPQAIDEEELSAEQPEEPAGEEQPQA
jgi:small subunit ribosomal protein S6